MLPGGYSVLGWSPKDPEPELNSACELAEAKLVADAVHLSAAALPADFIETEASN